ncbi:Gfo/Idh/MocA family protein [Ammoniphilus resinae]|uniref:Dehydrogenase n=1 Tax=Ammoniphilus resinae TaxID=861532 RepID=A0ABS4GWB0_9BACL|nr:Gfo/Idh/MocA family oxidoreductase [Ammoniphilus resinae]MBP1934560.1 putative dehydrogenase [Ammoniphilus resinae]
MRRKIKVAVIGAGRVGNSHIQAILKSPEQIELGGIVEQQAALANETAKTNNTRAFYSVEEALSNTDIDAYVVCLPHHLHYPIGKQILEAGRHVLIEKPLGIHLREVRDLIQTAEKHGVYVMSGQSRRFYNPIQQAKEYLPAIDGPTNLLYNFACIFTKDSAPVWWREEKKTGGLVLGMLGSHSIDMTLWMFEGRRPVRVYCETRKITDVFEGDDAGSIIITFDDGCIATNYLSICHSPLKHECLIEGRKGSIYFNHEGDHDGVIGTSATKVLVNGKQLDTSDDPDCFTLQIREFTSAILENRQPSTSAQNVYSSYLVLEAAKESAKKHQSIDLREFI